MIPGDGELVRLAQGGDVPSLGILLERHRPHLYALALQILGATPVAEDAVQDTFLIALRRIDSLREPAATAGWLRAILRNVCYARIRQGHDIALNDNLLRLYEARHVEESIEDRIDRLALRDWVWAAMAELPEPLRVTAMLRYFGSWPAYREIAAILGVPVGTVKSRLNQVRVKLAGALLRTAELEHSETRELTRYYTSQFQQVADLLNRGELDREFLDTVAVDVSGVFGRTAFQERGFYESGLKGDIVDGVKLHPTNVLASHGVAVLEARFESPPDDPFHCPPGMSTVFFIEDSIIRRMRVFHVPRAE